VNDQEFAADACGNALALGDAFLRSNINAGLRLRRSPAREAEGQVERKISLFAWLHRQHVSTSLFSTPNCPCQPLKPGAAYLRPVEIRRQIHAGNTRAKFTKTVEEDA
jgi:hypothetical protein